MSKSEISPARSQLIVIVVGLIVLAGIGGLIYAHLSVFAGFGRADKNSPDCIPTTATITDRQETYGRTKGYYITYSWEVPGKGTFSQEEKIDESTWLITGSQTVEICYMKDDPELATILMNDQGFIHGFLVLLVDFMLILSVFLIWRMARKEAKKKQSQ